jgi:hypothetical protein
MVISHMFAIAIARVWSSSIHHTTHNLISAEFLSLLPFVTLTLTWHFGILGKEYKPPPRPNKKGTKYLKLEENKNM